MQHLLHVERQQEELREDGGAGQQAAEVGARERAQPEHPQGQERGGRASLDSDEGADHSDGRSEQADRLTRAPAVLGGTCHRIHEQHQAAGDRGGTRHVEVAVSHVRAALVQEARRKREHERPDRHVDEEDPRPTEGAREGPPSSTPAAPPLPETAPQIPRARFRSCPSANVVVRIESAAGASRAAPSPCKERKAISEPDDQANPASSEEVVKSASPTMNIRRRPSRSAMRPPSNNTPPNRIE